MYEEQLCLSAPLLGDGLQPQSWKHMFLCTSQGRNVVLESKYGSPRIVNDGVTVAKEVELEDPVENIGAKLVRQVYTRTQTSQMCISRTRVAEHIHKLAVGSLLSPYVCNGV